MIPEYEQTGFAGGHRVIAVEGVDEGPYQLTTPSGRLVQIEPMNESSAQQLAQGAPVKKRAPKPAPPPPPPKVSARARLLELLRDAASPAAWEEIATVRRSLDALDKQDIWSDSQRRYIEEYVDGALAEILHRLAEMVLAVVVEENRPIIVAHSDAHAHDDPRADATDAPK